MASAIQWLKDESALSVAAVARDFGVMREHIRTLVLKQALSGHRATLGDAGSRGAATAALTSIDFDRVGDHKASRSRPCVGRNRLSFDIKALRRFGRVSRVAKGADCKSAVLRLRRFESYLSHQPSSYAGVAQW